MPARRPLFAQEPPFWSLVPHFDIQNPSFFNFYEVLRVRVGPNMFHDIVLSLTHFPQPFFASIFAILYLLKNFLFFLSMDFRGPWGSPKGVFDEIFK